MSSLRYALPLTCGWLAFLALGCRGRGPADDPVLAEEWVWLQETQQALQGERVELAELQGQAAAVEGTPELGQRLAQLDAEVTTRAEEFATRLVAFLNADPLLQGQAPSQRQFAAVRMKSAEDVILAQEWIDKGGDYKRALDIYDTALALDPENPELEAARAAAEVGRFITAESFALAREGMSQIEVRALLGQPNPHNIREYVERGVVAWFYPTSERGDAAGVWFEVSAQSGESRAYELKFEAIRRQEAEGGGN